MRDRLRSPASLHLVVGEPVVGVLLVELVDRRLELTLLCVHPDDQRSGLGGALVAAALARYPALTAWSAEPATCEALGLVRTGAVRDDGAVELTSSISPPERA